MIRLNRSIGSDKGTYGVLSMDGQPLCVTCELPWINNEKNISCIPAGEYQCTPYTSEHFKNVWQINNVPERDLILIHSGNYTTDTHGCVIVGSGFFLDKPGVTNSVQALVGLKQKLPSTFTLTITGV